MPGIQRCGWPTSSGSPNLCNHCAAATSSRYREHLRRCGAGCGGERSGLGRARGPGAGLRRTPGARLPRRLPDHGQRAGRGGHPPDGLPAPGPSGGRNARRGERRELPLPRGHQQRVRPPPCAPWPAERSSRRGRGRPGRAARAGRGPRGRGDPRLAAPGPGHAASAGGRDLRPPLPRRPGQSRHRASAGYLARVRGRQPAPHPAAPAGGARAMEERPAMRDETRRKESSLDDAIASLRDDVPASDVAGEAAARVWERLAPARLGFAPSSDAIAGCADVVALLPAHRRGELPAARALLIEDHLRDCVACRGASLRPGERHLALLPWRASSGSATTAPRRRRQYAMAATVLLAALASAWAVHQAFFRVPAGSRAAVQSVSGGLQRIAADTAVRLSPGAEIGEAELVRTAGASRAVLRLGDGSLVEMSERAELSVRARGRDTTIHLTRGRIIVQAAKRRSGHLRVASGDCTVSVTGTVFSVNNGIKGSRVSVFEGSVRVAGMGDEQVLAPGDQWATSAAMESVPLREEIAWSADLDRHLALLSEVKVLRERFRTVPTPCLRYDNRLLRGVPEA